MNSRMSKNLKIIGIISIVIAIFMSAVLVPSVISMAEYEGASTQEIIIRVIILAVMYALYFIAGLSTLIVNKLSHILYLVSLVYSMLLYIYSLIWTLAHLKNALWFFYFLSSFESIMFSIIFGLPILISMCGFILSSAKAKDAKSS